MGLKPVTVSQLNEYISRVIGTDPLLGAVVVKGETSGVKYHGSGHVYFSIVDGASKINCFLPRDYVESLTYQLTDGTEVVLTGSVSVYKKNGSYSLYVKHVEMAGEGDMAAAFAQMKNKLQQEGLFDPAHKKPIPKFPERIGIVTSATGAAVEDMLKILKTRRTWAKITVFPVLVQGQDAAADISTMLDYINEKHPDIDTLIVGRGGGSAEDLWPFNEEVVARSIYRSKIPVISAVGHEIDFTISDLVADLRAETPTAAAQLAVPDTAELLRKLAEMRDYLHVQLTNKLMYQRLFIDNRKADMKNALTERISALRHKIGQCKLILEENNPSQILQNGYTILTDETGAVISTAHQIKKDEQYRITLQDGYAKCLITEIGSDTHGQK